MTGWRDACLIAAFAAGFAAIGGETPALADDAALTRGQVCGGDEIARGIVGKILDGRTFVLDDGREVRLVAIEVPSLAGDRTEHPKAAREAQLGLWADPYYEVLNAESPKDALAQRGRFARVEGKVASVREKIYVNFGRRRIGDITVTILKRNERSFAAAGLDLRGLAGRRVRVRGWIEARGGERAWIEAERLEQIEIAD